ncbi:TIM-barrel domain-containing protein [Paenibacillus allorhizosphaerae]|uniref:Glycosyl hydrolase family 31 C-terminal domain-containing protein n=1 Tax=Paenibacillus allorhizosphaerae TaxID=2849866 RepID=A0ABM8VDH7_9BACL|nr:TIM-barrel domain-containing protein [Paenibacillus allorhizosphaerae]CAG7627799.1 hypothetical protein PAECIP111802_01390 [Paenibacillus allorhizosphaerae]
MAIDNPSVRLPLYRFEERGEQIIITTKSFTMTICKKGFRFGFRQPACGYQVEPHAVSGLRFSDKEGKRLYDATHTKVMDWNEEALHLLVENTEGQEADVRLAFGGRYVRFDITPSLPGAYTIDVRTAPMSPVYGLGDYGSLIDTVPTEQPPARGKLDVQARDRANLFGYHRSDMVNQGTNMRFLSNFTVYPAHRFAQVLFEEGAKRVAFTEKENKLGASNVARIGSLYYFTGTMREIYSDYRNVRIAEGYPDKKPKYEMFRVGWEAYGSLGWNSYQTEVEEALRQYLERGYELAWGVIGSGFWKGDRKGTYEGTTTSFGIWDDAFEEGRTDGLANPRFPDVNRLKSFFAERGIKLILGLRNHVKAPEADGGFNHPVYNGPFAEEAIQRGYLLKHADGSLLRITNAQFPAGTVYVLDSRNPEALDWFVSKAALWEAQGFKEDAMLYTKHYADGNWNQLNAALMDENYCVIVRNSAYGVPGDLLRINDTYFGTGEGYHFDQDRVPINLLNIAASGASNLYPDITGGTPKTDPSLPSYQNYFVRNAMFNAVTPGMSLGRKPWEMNHPHYEQCVKKAADWHNRYAPYIYSAVLESYHTGYPLAMTPLHIAYPDDAATYDLINRHTRQYEWMLGPSMLAAPLFGNDFDTAQSRDIYLPAGIWIDYETGERFQGPVTLHGYPMPPSKIPVFIGGQGVVVSYDREEDACYAEAYPVAERGNCYTHQHADGSSVSRVRHEQEGWNPQTLRVEDNVSGQAAACVHQEKTGSFRFRLEPGRDYTIRGGK